MAPLSLPDPDEVVLAEPEPGSGFPVGTFEVVTVTILEEPGVEVAVVTGPGAGVTAGASAELLEALLPAGGVVVGAAELPPSKSGGGVADDASTSWPVPQGIAAPVLG